jgi:hypothetical protein
MIINDVYKHFGSGSRAANAIGLTRAAFYKWTKRGFIPLTQQKKFESITNGILLADKKDTNVPKSRIYTIFRFYDKKYGMRNVKSIYFMEKKGIKIIYIGGGKRISTIVPNIKNIMQAVDLKDVDGKILYEGDIVVLKNGKKFIFKNNKMVDKLKKLGQFKIVGNIFE